MLAMQELLVLAESLSSVLQSSRADTQALLGGDAATTHTATMRTFKLIKNYV